MIEEGVGGGNQVIQRLAFQVVVECHRAGQHVRSVRQHWWVMGKQFWANGATPETTAFHQPAHLRLCLLASSLPPPPPATSAGHTGPGRWSWMTALHPPNKQLAHTCICCPPISADHTGPRHWFPEAGVTPSALLLQDVLATC